MGKTTSENILLTYVALAVALCEKKSFDAACELALETQRSLTENKTPPINLADKMAMLIKEALSNLIHCCAAYNDTDESAFPFAYDDYRLDGRIKDPNLATIAKNAAAQIVAIPGLSPYQRNIVVTVFQLMSKSAYEKNHFGTTDLFNKLLKNSENYVANRLFFIEHRMTILQFVDKQIQLKQENLIELKMRLEQINKTAAIALKEIDAHYEKLLSDTIHQIGEEFARQQKKAIKEIRKNTLTTIVSMAATMVFAPYLAGALASTAFGGLAAAGAAAEAVAAGTATMSTGLTLTTIDAISAAIISTSTQAVLSNNFKDFHTKLFQNVLVNCGGNATEYLAAGKPAAMLAKGSTQAMKVSAAAGAVKAALRTGLEGGKVGKNALLEGVCSASGEGFVGLAGEPLKKSIDLKQAHRAMDEALRTSAGSAIRAAANGENILSEAIYGAANGFLTTYLADGLAEGMKSVIRTISTPAEPEPYKQEEEVAQAADRRRKNKSEKSYDADDKGESGEDVLAISLSIHKLYKNNQPEHRLILTSFDSGAENETDTADETVTSVTTNKRNNAAKNSKLPDAGKARLGRKNGANGKQWFDIDDGQYVGATDKSKNKILSKALGKKIASSFALELKVEHLLSEHRQEIYDWGLLTPTYTDNGGRGYFSAKLDPAKARITIEAGAEKKIQFILDQSSYEFMQGLGKFDYVIEAYSVNAICKASASTERGIDANAKTELSALGPNFTASIKLPAVYIFGVGGQLNVDITAGIGVGSSLGAGITLDKTRQQLRPHVEIGIFRGWGAKIKSFLSLGADPEFVKHYPESYEIAINRPESRQFTSKVQTAMEKLDHANPVSFWSRLANNMQRSTYEEMLEDQEQRNQDYARYNASSIISIRKP